MNVNNGSPIVEDRLLLNGPSISMLKAEDYRQLSGPCTLDLTPLMMIYFCYRIGCFYGGDPIIQQNVCGGDSSRASICIKILKYNSRFFFENLIDCSKTLIYNIPSFRKF